MAEKMVWRHWPDPAGCMHAWVLAGPRLHVALRDDVSCICLMHVSCMMHCRGSCICRELKASLLAMAQAEHAPTN